MKADEIVIRQDRVVYTLMILLASLGLLWSFWQHSHHDESASPAPRAQAAASHSTPANTVYVQ